MLPEDDIAQYKGLVGCLGQRCPLCPLHSAASSPLLRCTGCRAFTYCSREHQVAHMTQHKSTCTEIEEARANLEREDKEVHNATEDSERDHMRARFGLAEKLISLGTLDSVSEGLEHMCDVLRIYRSDDMGIRSIVPATMLRLDLDQECYDFIKWWVTCNSDGTSDRGDTTLPYLDIHGADVLEDVDFLVYPATNLDFLVASLLLKLKLLVDIRNLKIARKVLARGNLPVELRDMIELEVVRSPLSIKLQRETYASLVEIEKKLSTQSCQIGRAIARNNRDFMINFFNPEDALCDRPGQYSHGFWIDVAIALQNSYAAWWETEGILDLLNDARACAVRDWEYKLDDPVMSEWRRRWNTAEEILTELSVNYIWGYIDYAVENASYLGPWSERPSEMHTRKDRESYYAYKEKHEDHTSR